MTNTENGMKCVYVSPAKHFHTDAGLYSFC